MLDEKTLGRLAYNRLLVLSGMENGHNRESLKEQLREIEKSMIFFGWDGEAHKVVQTPDGPRLKKYTPIKPKGIVIAVKQFKMKPEIKLF